MWSMRLLLPWLVVTAACATVGARATAQQNPDQVTVKFSDPSRPGKLRVNVINGGITVRGANRNDVAIEARPRSERSQGVGVGRGRGRGGRTVIVRDGNKVFIDGGRGNSSDSGTAPSTGLRRLEQPAGFIVEESNNELVVAGSPSQSLDFEIEVPTRTNLQLNSANDGAIVVDRVEGELEVNNPNGAITLTNVAGSVVATAVNGTVKAVLTQVTSGKAMAFTSLNGNVDLTLPVSAKANLKLRSDMGDVLTDFDVQLRPNAPIPVDDQNRSRGRFRIEVNRSLIGTINGGGPEFELRTFNGNVYLRKGT
jgi:hypothetical protein